MVFRATNLGRVSAKTYAPFRGSKWIFGAPALAELNEIFLGQGAARLSWSRENIASMIPRPEIVLYSRESSSRPNSSKI
jgi:hypothetical protein